MSADTTLVIKRHFKATPEQVFEAWTNPQLLVKWWGPQGVTTPVVELDVREGGNWTTTMHSDEMGHREVSGTYVTLVPPHRLVLTWGWSDEGKRGHETIVEILLEASNNGTAMTLTQKEFETAQSCSRHNMGWDSSFIKLDQSLA